MTEDQPRSSWQGHTGPATARLYQGLLSVVMAIAWLSLAAQVRVLIGARGLQPLGDVLAEVDERELGFLEFPTLLRWLPATDGWLVVGCWVGVGLSLATLLGVFPRLAILVSAALYLSYTVACGTFLSFQWDNLAIESLLIGALLSRDRPSPWAHAAGRLLLFKVFFESAIAKSQSPIGDWWDGSAMSFYYETSPLPTWLAWYAHHLPAAWHAFEGYWTLFFEGVLVFGVFGPRPARLAALAAFVSFLAVDAATSNYGFFVHLTGALCVLLLDERDVVAARDWLVARLPWSVHWRGLSWPSPLPERLQSLGVASVVVLWAALSALGAVGRFTESRPLEGVVEVARELRVANVYHLFTSITRERVEPEFQARSGEAWTVLDMHYKPGDPSRAPPFVAPHQPRVDFRLWFYGLSYERGVPGFVRVLLDRICHDPGAVEDLFARAIPRHADAVRIVFWRYMFTSPDERAATGAWWAREEVGRTRDLACQ